MVGLVWIGLVLLAIIAGGLASAGACSGGRSESFEFRSGVLVDSDAATCYLMNTTGGIDALDLRSGEVLWTTTIAQRPLLLLGDALVAQAEPEERGNVFRLVLLDTENLGAQTAQVDIDLPDAVEATIDDGAGRIFRVEAWAVPGGCAVAWDYVKVPVRGADDGSPVAPQVRRIEGAAVLDFETGTVYPIAQDERPEEPPLPAELARLEEAGRLPRPLWRSGEVYAAALRVHGDGTERTVLRRWQAATGDSLPDVKLFIENHTIRYPSADNTHLLVSSRARATRTPSSYDWQIFLLTTGERVGELRLGLPAAWFFVTGSLLVHEVQSQAQLTSGAWTEEPRKLRSVDLDTGAEQWTWPLRDTAYRGSLPPNAPELPKPEDATGSSVSSQQAEGEQTP